MTLAQQHYGCGTTVETREGIFHWNVGSDEPKRSKVATKPADFSIGMADFIIAGSHLAHIILVSAPR
jgi:hypothetical protein